MNADTSVFNLQTDGLTLASITDEQSEALYAKFRGSPDDPKTSEDLRIRLDFRCLVDEDTKRLITEHVNGDFGNKYLAANNLTPGSPKAEEALELQAKNQINAFGLAIVAGDETSVAKDKTGVTSSKPKASPCIRSDFRGYVDEVTQSRIRECVHGKYGQDLLAYKGITPGSYEGEMTLRLETARNINALGRQIAKSDEEYGPAGPTYRLDASGKIISLQMGGFDDCGGVDPCPEPEPLPPCAKAGCSTTEYIKKLLRHAGTPTQ